MPFIDVDLVNNILRMVPRQWPDSNELTGATVTQIMKKILEACKHIDKVILIDKEHKGNPRKVKTEDSSKKKMISFSKHISKKGWAAKHCALCKKYVKTMGMLTRPDKGWSAVIMQGMGPQKGHLQEEVLSAMHNHNTTYPQLST